MRSKIFHISCLLLLIILTACSAANSGEPATPTAPIMQSTATSVVASTSTIPAAITLKMNSAPLTSYAPIFIAEDEGFFAEQGIQMEYVTLERSKDALPLLISGDLDIYAGSLTPGLLNTLGQEDGIKVVADRGHLAPSDTCANQGILFRKEPYDSGQLRGPADLAGRTIIASQASPSEYLLSLYLAQAGLSVKDVNMIDIPPVNYVQAMADGSADAVVAPELRLSNVLNGGNAVLAVRGTDVYGSLLSSALVFGKNLRKDNRQAGIRFLKAYLKGVAQYNQGKTDRNVQIIASHTGETEETIRNACWVSISADGSIDFKAWVDGFQQWSVQQGYLDAAITEGQFWDPSLLNETLKEMSQ